ncbi:hypothetical protein GCM10023347_33670 [Streptomyces chumphonensis]|uniref:Uncharacterized protein n=1 Tax=Streptomyces chumphonensis TaxID=1214925 RepID=A0A927IAQ3_9ACTN|nr:hypothetical protein [Streptomyces chumphonensis]MBD3931963.1 hypothetical protein [Streptomyces chumphonensis]
MTTPDPTFPHPQVHLVIEIDLRGPTEDMTHKLREQTRRAIPDGADVEVFLGDQYPPLGLGRLIASACYFSARSIAVRAPASNRMARHVAGEIDQHAREFRQLHGAWPRMTG